MLPHSVYSLGAVTAFAVRLCTVAAIGLVPVFSGAGLALAQSEGVTIESGDRIAISVKAEASIEALLSGQFRVEADGTINYPVLGTVMVRGLSPEQLSSNLKEAFGERVPIIGQPTVSIAEYAPVFVIGDVGSSGPVEFQPNLTVLELMLLVGGVRPGGGSPTADAAARADMALEVAALQVERERLRAQVRGEDFGVEALPSNLPAAIDDVVAHEVDIFNAHRRAEQVRAAAYERQREVLDQRVLSLEQSIELNNEEVRLSEERAATQRVLVERAIATRSTLTELELSLLLTKRLSIEAQTRLFEAQQDRAALEQEIAEKRLQLEAERLQSLRDVENDLVRARARLEESGGPAVETAEAKLPSEAILGVSATFTLIRKENGTYKLRSVNENAELQRGDVLRVDSGAPEAPTPVALEANPETLRTTTSEAAAQARKTN